MSGKKENTSSAGDKSGSTCVEECVIGIEDCAECGVCGHCADDAGLDENETPTHWQKFIQKSRKTP